MTGTGIPARDDITGLLGLIEIDTPDGPARFMVGVDGVFRDIEGRAWAGSQLLSANEIEWSRGGEAPEGSLSLSYFQDPAAPDLIAQIRDLGADYVDGRTLRYYVQPIGSMADFYAPRLAPVLIATRRAGAVTFELQGDIVRRLSLTVEGPLAGRRAARSRFYTVDDHTRLIGTANPSLEFMPLEPREEEALFG